MQNSTTTIVLRKTNSAGEKTQDPRDRGKTWTHNETEALCRLWSSDDIQLQLRSTLRNNHVFRVISKRLSTMGYARTPDQCRTKVKSLKSTYRRLKDLNNPKKAQRVFGFFKLMDRTLSKQRLTMATALDVKTEIAVETTVHMDGGDDDDDDNGQTVANSGWYMSSSTSQTADVGGRGDGEAAGDNDSTTYLDGSACDDNSNGLEELGEEDEDDDGGDSAASLLDTLPLAIQLGNCSDDLNDDEEDNDDGEDVKGALINDNDNDESGVGRQHLLSAPPHVPLHQHHHQQQAAPPPAAPLPKRRRTTASKAAQNHQEEVADRILAKYMSHEERLMQHFLKAEEKMWTRMEQMEERRMKFEQDLMAKQRQEDSERFRQLFMLLSNPSPSHGSAPQPAGPPRVVYMQEVGPPSWPS